MASNSRLQAGELGLPPPIVVVELHLDDGPDPLWPEEEDLLSPRAVESHRAQFRLGRAAAHEALRILGRDAGPILRGPHGEPLWPPGVVGAITHSAGRALAAVAPGERIRALGLDMEHTDRWFPELAETVAFDAERAWLEGLEVDRRRAAALEMFSAKESIYKALFPAIGTFFGFDAVRLARTDHGYAGRFVTRIDRAPDEPIPVWCEWDGAFVVTSIALPA